MDVIDLAHAEKLYLVEIPLRSFKDCEKQCISNNNFLKSSSSRFPRGRYVELVDFSVSKVYSNVIQVTNMSDCNRENVFRVTTNTMRLNEDIEEVSNDDGQQMKRSCSDFIE